MTQTFSPIRAAIVLGLIGCALIALTGRVAYLQTYGREQTIRRAERQQHQGETLYARRGSIFDSTGMLMAGTVQRQSLFVDPKFMHESFEAEGRSLVEMDKAIAQLADMIDWDSLELSMLIGDRSTARFVRVAQNLDETACREIMKLDLPGIGLQPMHVRYYPMGSIAAHVLGGTQRDGIGLEGIELRFEKQLAGKNGYKRTLKDARRRPIAVAAEDYLPPEHGQHLVLTIDANIQMIAEQELAAVCEQFRANRGEVIVMEPRTGEILAMANWPSFNPQNLEDSTPDMRRNRCLTDPYEPGSTIKPFIVGPALAHRLTRAHEVFPINGPNYKSPLRRKLVTDVHPYGQLATWDVLVKSSNIGMVMIGERMGSSRLHSALGGFGFGSRTGIELPGEDPGLLYPLNKWRRDSVVSISMGYEMMLTPLQLARAFCAFGNGGRLVEPRIVKGVLDADGKIIARSEPTDLEMMPQIIDPITAGEMKRILADVPVRGTAQRARSKTWNIFGKTGTAHVSRGGNYENTYTSSFVGGAPAESPRLIVALIVHEPDRDHAISQGLMYYGGSVAGPGAGRVLDRSLAYLQVDASPPLPPPPPHIASTLHNYDPRAYRMPTASARE